MSGSSSLFEPTVQDHAPRPPAEERSRPWRLQSQGYVAFFGGPLAIAAIAGVNARKLGLGRPQVVRIALAGGVGFLIAVALAVTVLNDNGTLWRLVASALGLAVYAFAAAAQRQADRGYLFRHGDDEYAALVGPGIAAVLAARLVEFFFVLPLMTL